MEDTNFKGIFDNVPVGLYRTTPSGIIIEANEAMAAMLGYESATELRKQSAEALYADAKDRQAWMRYIEHHGVARNFEMRWRHKDGTIFWVKNSTKGVRNEDGIIVFYEGVVEDITESQKLKDLALSAHTEDLRDLDLPYLEILDELQLCAVRKNLNGEIVFANLYYCDTEVGLRREQVLGKTDFDFYDGGLAAKYREDDHRVQSSGTVFRAVEEHKTIDASLSLFFHVVKAPVRNSAGKIVGVQCLFWNSKEDQNVMVTLHETISQASIYRSLFAKAFTFLLRIRPNQYLIEHANEEALTILSRTTEALMGTKVSALFDDENWSLVSTLLRRVSDGSSAIDPVGPREVDFGFAEDKISLEITVRGIRRQGSIISFAIHGRDISERKRAESAKLKEIHHRVKNNLQVVSNLLSLEAENSKKDPKAYSVLLAAESRIQAMALIHKLLYQTRNISRIDMATYFKSLCGILRNAYPLGEQGVTVRYNVDENIRFDLDSALPCGLILNELFSNSLKHAFPNGRRGEIRVGLTREGEGMYRLQVSDNGIGIQKEMDMRTQQSLGMRLVIGTAEKQLRGTFELGRNYGTTFTIRFREANDARQ